MLVYSSKHLFAFLLIVIITSTVFVPTATTHASEPPLSISPGDVVERDTWISVRREFIHDVCAEAIARNDPHKNGFVELEWYDEERNEWRPAGQKNSCLAIQYWEWAVKISKSGVGEHYRLRQYYSDSAGNERTLVVVPFTSPRPEVPCGNGITLQQEDIANIEALYEALGVPFNSHDPCLAFSEEISITFGDPYTSTRQRLPSDIAGPVPNEQCFNDIQTVEHKNLFGGTLATAHSGYRYCTNGELVYGDSGKIDTEPRFTASVIGARGVAVVADIVCGPETNGEVVITGSGWESYNGYNHGSFITTATTLCEFRLAPALGGDLLVINTFDVSFEAGVYSSSYNRPGDPQYSYVELFEIR